MMNSNPAPANDNITINGIRVPDVDVHMVCSSIPFFEKPDSGQEGKKPQLNPTLPSRYQVRTYVPGDEAIWQSIQIQAEPFMTIADTLFQNQFGAHIESLAGRMFFLEYMNENGQSTTVGTATAWWKDDWKGSGPWGQVHWVAILPSHQRRGLTKPLMVKVMDRIAQSHSRAMLGTSTGRIWAIKVYLDYGFLPDERELAETNIKDAWHQLQQVLDHPALEKRLK